MSCRICLLPIFCLLLTACSDVYDVSYDYDKQYEISRLQTFGWLPLTKKNQNRFDELTFKRIQAVVNSELESKGYSAVADDPDLSIEVTYGAKSRNRRAGRRNWYNFREGYLHVSFVDPRTDGLIWAGSAKVVLNNEGTPEGSQKIIDEVVRKILGNFPP